MRVEPCDHTKRRDDKMEKDTLVRLLRESPKRLETSNNFAVVAHLVEAACCASEGDCETTRAHIARAVALLRGQPSSMLTATRVVRIGPQGVVHGGLAVWQARRVIAHVDAKLAGKIRMDDLAAVLDLSSSHFCRAFKQTLGISPRDYVALRRIEVAQGLMLTTRDSLSAIALSCGLSDQSHFTRLFRRMVGETPHSWRRSRRGVIEDQTTELVRHSAPAAQEDHARASRTTTVRAAAE